MEHVQLHAASGWKQQLMPELVQFDQSAVWKDNQIPPVQRESHREEEREDGVLERRAGALNVY